MVTLHILGVIISTSVPSSITISSPLAHIEMYGNPNVQSPWALPSEATEGLVMLI